MKKVNVAIVDHVRLMRSGLALSINSLQEYSVVLEADDREDLLQKLTLTSLPDIILIEI